MHQHIVGYKDVLAACLMGLCVHPGPWWGVCASSWALLQFSCLHSECLELNIRKVYSQNMKVVLQLIQNRKVSWEHRRHCLFFSLCISMCSAISWQIDHYLPLFSNLPYCFLIFLTIYLMYLVIAHNNLFIQFWCSHTGVLWVTWLAVLSAVNKMNF